MVRMGRGETMSPGVLPWHMDAVAERYAQQDGQTLQAAGHLVALFCLIFGTLHRLLKPLTAPKTPTAVRPVCMKRIHVLIQ